MGGTAAHTGSGDDPSGAAPPPRGPSASSLITGVAALAAAVAIAIALSRGGGRGPGLDEASTLASRSDATRASPISPALSADSVRAHLALAATKEEAGAHKDAAAAYDAALRGLDPDHVPEGLDLFDIRTRQADALIGAGDTRGAIAALDAISEPQRGRPYARALRAKCALADAGGSDWPPGTVDAMLVDAPAPVAMRYLSNRFVVQAKRELGLGLAREALLDAQVAAALAPLAIEPSYYVGAAFVARKAAGNGRPGDDAKARIWLKSFVTHVDVLGVGATDRQTSMRDEASKLLETLPSGK